jgi:hypothetical protein
MLKGKPLQEQVTFLFSAAMCFVYIGVGVFFIRKPHLFGSVPQQAMIVVGIACIVYAIFRGVRLVITALKN